MVIEFPKPLFTIQDRKEQQLCDFLELNAEAFERIGIDLTDEQLEYIALVINDILEEA